VLSSWKPQVKCWGAELDKLTVMKLMHLEKNHSFFGNAAAVGCYKAKCYNIAWLTDKLNLESQLEIKYGTQYL